MTRFCAYCGREIQNGICPECGVTVDSQNRIMQESTAFGKHTTANPSPRPTSNAQLLPYICIALILLIGVLVGVLAYQCGRSQSGDNEAVTSPTSSVQGVVQESEGITTEQTTTTTTAPTTRNNDTVSLGVATGDVVTFGQFEQDNNRSNGAEAIEWRVLDVSGGRALLISKKALYVMPFHNTLDVVKWADCDLRRWLNSDFYNDAFSTEQKKQIPEVELTNGRNPYYNIPGGPSTNDRVFCLSTNEAKNYFKSDTDRIAKPTPYVKALGGNIWEKNGNCFWWLRTPGGNDGRNAAEVECEGRVVYLGGFVTVEEMCVRPAIYVDLQ